MEIYSFIKTSLFSILGNPGLGLSLSLDDFGCEANPPEWLPRDRWENVMAISVLPGALDNLCVKIAENSERWHKWYNGSTPEREMVSQSADVGDAATESSENQGGNAK